MPAALAPRVGADGARLRGCPPSGCAVLLLYAAAPGTITTNPLHLGARTESLRLIQLPKKKPTTCSEGRDLLVGSQTKASQIGNPMSFTKIHYKCWIKPVNVCELPPKLTYISC